ncbi:MAG: DNA polymerase III subunit delta [Alistipes sp.]|nr:DNA polymerase III subunit delta [Alistipes sp.]
MAEKVTFASCEAEFHKLMNDIKGRKFAPIYLLQGEELYFIDALCNALTENIMDESMRAFNQIVIYGNDTDGGTVASYCRQLPMMGEYEAIIVKEAQQLDKIEQLHGYTASPQPSTILVLCHKGKAMDRRTPLYKSIKANGVVFDSISPRDYEAEKWISGFAATKGLKLDSVSGKILVAHLGVDISKISNELEKMIVSLPKERNTITPEDIENHIGISRQFNNYELSNAVLDRQMEKALTIAQHMGENPKAYPLLLTVKVLYDSFRQLFTYNYMCWDARRRGVAAPDQSEMCRAMRLNSPYFLKDIARRAPLWPNAKVFKILGLCAEYDAKSKGIDDGGASNGELLREFILKIMML